MVGQIGAAALALNVEELAAVPVVEQQIGLGFGNTAAQLDIHADLPAAVMADEIQQLRCNVDLRPLALQVVLNGGVPRDAEAAVTRGTRLQNDVTLLHQRPQQTVDPPQLDRGAVTHIDGLHGARVGRRQAQAVDNVRACRKGGHLRDLGAGGKQLGQVLGVDLPCHGPALTAECCSHVVGQRTGFDKRHRLADVRLTDRCLAHSGRNAGGKVVLAGVVQQPAAGILPGQHQPDRLRGIFPQTEAGGQIELSAAEIDIILAAGVGVICHQTCFQHLNGVVGGSVAGQLDCVQQGAQNGVVVVQQSGEHGVGGQSRSVRHNRPSFQCCRHSQYRHLKNSGSA